MIRLLVRRPDLGQLYCVSVSGLIYQDGFLWWHEEYCGEVDTLQIPISSCSVAPLLSRALEVGFVDLSSFAAREVPDDE